jgi:Na+/H+ antiporter NhaD/arsenite permease-like protein
MLCICPLYTPIVLAITVQTRGKPMPYLQAPANASNIGSVMTVTVNPSQKMLFGIYSKDPYLIFLRTYNGVVEVTSILSLLQARS